MTEATIPTRNGGSHPTPDPTVLTTEALTREVNALKSLLELRIDGEADARKAADTSLQDLKERELVLIERQRVEQKDDTKAAVDAALAAAKEAVKEQTIASGLSINKSENATNEQLKQLNVTFTTAVEGVNRTISDLKERVSNVEGTRQGTDATTPWVISIVVGLVAVVSLVIQFSQ